MARRLHQTLADYVVIAISPALIMTLVGSLVYFLLAVFYQGTYPERLAWVLGCFVFAAVLIGRISIEEGLQRAMPFGIALAIVVGIATNKFMEVDNAAGGLVQFSWIINWGLIALTWWCAHRLTWDCTMIDDSQDASGEGLLQTAGFESPDEHNRATLTESNPEGTTARQVPAGWWQRYVEHQRRPHAPGVWVVYFSLAALPLFGLGQWFIPAEDVATRRHAFGLLCVYVASGMALLVTTSFLGLRRYLRQRRIEMPTLMANLWLGIGATIIVLLLVVAALLPRPSAEYAVSQLPFTLGSPDQKSSRHAPVPEEGTKDDQVGKAPSKEPESEGKQEESQGKQEPTEGQASADSPGKDGPQTTSKKSEGKSKSGDGDRSSNSGSKSKQSKSGDSPDKQKADSPNDKQTDSKAKQDRNQNEPPAEESDDSQNKKAGESTEQQPVDKQPDEQKADQQKQPEQQPDDAEQAQPAEQAPTLQPPPLVETATGILGVLLKWAFYAVFALAVLYFLWRFRAEVLAAIRDFLAALRDLWDGLWGRRKPQGVAADEPIEIKLPPSPFSTFADPFAAGVAGRYTLDELVRYSFEAFEAWSREHGCSREPDQTPHELARDVAKLNRRMAADARNMAELYSRAAYARGELPATARDQLEHLWQAMRAPTAPLTPTARGGDPGEFRIQI